MRTIQVFHKPPHGINHRMALTTGPSQSVVPIISDMVKRFYWGQCGRSRCRSVSREEISFVATTTSLQPRLAQVVQNTVSTAIGHRHPFEKIIERKLGSEAPKFRCLGARLRFTA